ncbi:MAG: DUF4197 domain-containing protein [Verrucomicrobia bacterium]|nr:DUF4197 domain-containing protein [Verrucomicrobiota bacterium]
MKTFCSATVALLLCLLTAESRAADLLKNLGGLLTTNAAGTTALTGDEMTKGLKEALAKGAKSAITNLGKPDGFLKNLDVKIPLPETLKKVESAARLAGQGQLVDDFTVSMNRAAEQAVPAGLSILADSITKMSITDAQAILKGAPDAATQYFKRNSEAALAEKFRPIIAKATDAVGVTQKYKELTGKFGEAQALTSLFGSKKSKASSGGALDVDGYVTGRAMDGLFKMIAAEEKSIRANPAARTTEILQKVFAAPAK